MNFIETCHFILFKNEGHIQNQTIVRLKLVGFECMNTH